MIEDTASWPPLPESPFAADDLEGVLRPLEEAWTLPARAYLDPDVFAFEKHWWFERDWICVGREQDAPVAGSWFVAPVGVSGVIVIRGDDLVLRAFRNVCRHRGTQLVTGAGTSNGRIRCPYHAWSYDSQGHLRSTQHTDELVDFARADFGLLPARLATFGGFVFVSLDADAIPLLDWLDDLPEQFSGIPIDSLQVGKRIQYEVGANWKVLMENFAESYHFPTVHPQLEGLTSARRADTVASNGPWQGGWMPLDAECETVSLDGKRHGRKLLRSTGAHHHGVFDYLLFPGLFLSLQPDYLLAYRVQPIGVARTNVTFDILFHPAGAAEQNFDAPDVYGFWTMTNQQDFAICERQQAGIATPDYVAGRYTIVEDGVHEFDKIVAQRYLDP